MISKKSKFIIAVTTAIVMSSTNTLVVLGAENDGWTEATTTKAAKDGAWDAWCSEWEEIKEDWTKLSITPGSDETKLNFAWYSLVGENSPKVRVSKSKDMKEYVEFSGSQENAVSGYLSNKVTISGLEEKTTYYYSYGTNDVWSDVVSISTQDTSSFGFILVGDPQIGSSYKNVATGETEAMGQENSVRNDTFNWNNTINKALTLMPNASFMISAGDQISIRNKNATTEEALVYTENEIEYTGYLSPNALESLPVATTIGNHDAVSGNYSYHFNNPNTSSLGSTVAGGDYYYTYGNTLFIMLNTNNKNIAEHKEFIEEAIANSPDATWRIVTLHQDIYGSGEHSNEPDIAELRYGIVPVLEENDIDVVLTGHDHTYARSKILKGGTKNEETFLTSDEYEEFFEVEFESDNEILVEDKGYLAYLESIEDKEAVVTDLNIQGGKVIDPDGILYITANSASGSKYYNNVARQQEYIESRWQEDVPTFSTINVDEVSLTINTYRTDTMEKIDETYTLVKSLDKSNLLNLIEKAESLIEDSYTSSTWKVLQGALINAKTVSNQGDATEDVLAKAYTDLSISINSLVLKGDKTMLINAIDEAETLLNKVVIGNESGQYPEEAKEEFKQEINNAKNVLAYEDADENEVSEAINLLKKAIENFNNSVISNIIADNNDVNTSMDNSNTDNTLDSENSTVDNLQNEKDSLGTETYSEQSVENPKTGDKPIMIGIITAALTTLALIGLNIKKKGLKEK